MELLGASTSVGIHYDTRFSEETKCGVRIGLAYTNSSSEDFFEYGPERTTGWSFPIALNYLIGGKKHNLELGVGISYGIYSCHKNRTEESRKGAFGFLDIGYRYESNKGIMVRMGINPGMALSEYDNVMKINNGVNRAAVIYPYLSIGYSL